MPEIIRNYLLAAKPGIILGNLVSAAAGFFLASKGQIDLVVLSATLAGISLVVASACIFNNYIDRQLDLKMTRTRNRAIATGVISPNVAICYATLLGLGGAGLLFAVTNLVTFFIVLLGFAIYVVVYSLYMKRSSVYSTLVGSLSGAVPPVAGYCAVTGRLDLGVVLLFIIFSLWQMPHCYSIAVFRYNDYAAADIPVLPVKQGILTAQRHMVGYISAILPATLMLAAAGYTGYSTFVVAALLCLLWLHMAWWGYKASDERLWGKKLLVMSILTIFILSIMISIDFTPPYPS